MVLTPDGPTMPRGLRQSGLFHGESNRMSDLSNDQIEIIQDFVHESRDSIEQLEFTIIELGQSQGDPAVINSVFRLFHSMKGTASLLSLGNIAHVAHAAENLLDAVRSGGMELKSPDHVDLLIETVDFCKEGLDYIEGNLNDDGLAEGSRDLAARIEQEMKTPAAPAPTAAPAKDPRESISIEEALAMAHAHETPAPAPAKDPRESISIEEALAMVRAQEQPAPIEADEDIPWEEDDEPTGENEGAGFDIPPEMLQRFVTEAEELLENLEGGLLLWMKDSEEREIINGMFRSVHSFKGNCGFFGIADLERLSHGMEDIFDRIKRGEEVDSEPVGELFLKVADALKKGIADIAKGGRGEVPERDALLRALRKIQQSMEDGEERPLGEILIDEGLVSPSTVDRALQAQKRPLGQVLVEMGAASPEAINKALKKQPSEKPGAAVKKPAKRQDIRVDLDKLDNLINLIGELVIAENMLVNNPDLEGLDLENFQKAAQQTGKIVRELQEMAMVIRMVPVSGLFRRMIRLVHDVSLKVGKKVDLILEGEETEVDKTIIESLTDPLVHMIRNSVDHGIESGAARLSAGKPEGGTVRLSASHEEGEVWIVIEDDGGGLNRAKIIEKAIEKGLIEGDGSDMSDRQVWQLIFAPGFSTAESVTDVSGRGVGMDVVRQNLDKINCKIEVSSAAGKGSRFTLRIPLTLAIIDGMLIRVGGSRYIIPILQIRETFCASPETVTTTTDGQELVRVREEFIPVMRVHELHKIPCDSRKLEDGVLIILETAEAQVALFVDEILGQQQTVIKGISTYLAEVGSLKGVSGCTILGNGEVCLIIDIGPIIEQAELVR